MDLYSTFKQDFEHRLNGDIWGATTPAEAASVLHTVFDQQAIIEAFKRESDSWSANDFSRAIFWSSVQDLLSPFALPFKH